MADETPPVTADPIRLNVAAPFARVFMNNGRFFDIPLTQGWPQFMTNLLTHRGFLCDNAWIPERSINLILVNPDSSGVDLSNADLTKVIQFPPKT